MIRQISILMMALILIASSTYAQRTEEELNPKDPKAQEILDALSNKAKEYDSFSADFDYELKNSEAGLNEKQSGKVAMMGQTKYKLDVAGREIVSDGESVWTFIKDVGELQISDMPEEGEDDGNMMNPANAFHMYKNGFKYQYEGVETVDGKQASVIRMFPTDPGSKPFHTVVMNVDKPKLELISMIVKYKDGNVYTFRLRNFKGNVNLTAKDFTFDEDREDVEDIVDMRF